jgi:hypothetical protein
MAMSRKHYREVAEIINGANGEVFDTELSPAYVQGWLLSYVASGLATLFEYDNARFDRDKFMEACFPTPTE